MTSLGTLIIYLWILVPAGNGPDGVLYSRNRKLTLYRRDHCTSDEAKEYAGEFLARNKELKGEISYKWQADAIDVTPDHWTPAVKKYGAVGPKIARPDNG